ncbi:MAG TPA: DUF2723 domain-containing protein [Ignavibacteriaceae bacterium]|nr:DUF2723 domain-containing protein [Ignavibacteriaceae bacterium]
MTILTKYYYILTGLIAFIVYLFTLAPSVIQIDTGELAAVQATLGIAHPTGYPLYTIIGYLFSKIPLPFTTIYQLNLLAAIYCALAVSIFTYTSKFILDKIEVFSFQKKNSAVKGKKKDKRQKSVAVKSAKPALEFNESIKILSSVLAGISLAFSKTFWFQSTSVEVYSFHLLLISLIILFLIKAFVNRNESSDDIKTKSWLWFAFFLALSFTNHMTTLLILPGVAYLYFTRWGFNKNSLIRIGIMLLVFFPVLILIYSYFPIRSAQEPYLNWGNPVDWERIYRHISGFQYQVWLFSSADVAKKQFEYFINNFTSEFSITTIIVLFGVIISIIRFSKLFIFFLISFVFTVLYSINYDINDIDAYFLLAYVSLAFFSVMGFAKIFYELSENKAVKRIAVVIIILPVLIQAYSNYDEVDQSEVYVYEDYTKALMNSVEKDAIIFSYQWDYFLSASYYFQFVEDFRRDIAVVDKELLRRSWYFVQLEAKYPGLLDGVKNDITPFLEALKPFERKENFDSNLLETLFRRIMINLVATNINKREFYIAPEVVQNEMQRGEFSLPEGYFIVPHLFMFKVTKDQKYIPAPDPDFNIRFPERKDQYVNAIQNFIAGMLVSRTYYELQYNKINRAKVYLNKIRKDFPETRIPPQLQNLLDEN